MLAEHHVSLDFGYEGTTANYCIYLLWYLQKNGHLKSTDTVNVSKVVYVPFFWDTTDISAITYCVHFPVY